MYCLAKLLCKNFMKYNIECVESVNSTMDEVKKFENNTLLVANEQTAAKGKGRRSWDAKKSNNVYMSLVIDAANDRLDYSQLSFLTSIAVRNSIEFFDKKNNKIISKWPNDILINNKKAVGILLEYDLMFQRLVIGVGINVDYFPENIESIFKPTSLKNEGIIVEKCSLINKFLEEFDRLLILWKDKGFPTIRDIWLEEAYGLGCEICVEGEKGIFEDINYDGTLVLRLDNGELKEFYSGDVFEI